MQCNNSLAAINTCADCTHDSCCFYFQNNGLLLWENMNWLKNTSFTYGGRTELARWLYQANIVSAWISSTSYEEWGLGSHETRLETRQPCSCIEISPLSSKAAGLDLTVSPKPSDMKSLFFLQSCNSQFAVMTVYRSLCLCWISWQH